MVFNTHRVEDHGNMAESIGGLISYPIKIFGDESVVLEEVNPQNMSFIFHLCWQLRSLRTERSEQGIKFFGNK